MNGRADFAAFDPSLLRREIGRITLLDVSDPGAPRLLIRGEILNGVTVRIGKGVCFLDFVASTSREALSRMLSAVCRHPCIGVHAVRYRDEVGEVVAAGEVVLLPFERSARGQLLVMACTRLDGIFSVTSASRSVSIEADRHAYFDYGHGAPSGPGEKAHRLVRPHADDAA